MDYSFKYLSSPFFPLDLHNDIIMSDEIDVSFVHALRRSITSL